MNSPWLGSVVSNFISFSHTTILNWSISWRVLLSFSSSIFILLSYRDTQVPIYFPCFSVYVRSGSLYAFSFSISIVVVSVFVSSSLSSFHSPCPPYSKEVTHATIANLPSISLMSLFHVYCFGYLTSKSNASSLELQVMSFSSSPTASVGLLVSVIYIRGFSLDSLKSSILLLIDMLPSTTSWS